MALLGNLSEFPLPEVLLLIGSRTGRLHIYDLVGIAPVVIDLSKGYAHGLHIDNRFITEPTQMVSELSFMVEGGEGQFEFSPEPIIDVRRDVPLPISELVMLLVLHIDEKLAKQRALLAPQLFYLLETTHTAPELPPVLDLFFQQSRQLLSGGVRAEDLAEYLGLEEGMVRDSLDQLHRIGVVKLMETSDVETLRAMMLQKEISEKSNEFQLAVEASELIRRSGKLLRVPLGQ